MGFCSNQMVHYSDGIEFSVIHARIEIRTLVETIWNAILWERVHASLLFQVLSTELNECHATKRKPPFPPAHPSTKRQSSECHEPDNTYKNILVDTSCLCTRSLLSIILMPVVYIIIILYSYFLWFNSMNVIVKRIIC